VEDKLSKAKTVCAKASAEKLSLGGGGEGGKR